MRGQIIGGMALILMLCLEAGASQTHAWKQGGLKHGGTVAVNEGAAGATASLIPAATVTQSAKWVETADYEPLRYEAIRNAAPATGGVFTKVKAAAARTHTTKNENTQQAAWCPKGQAVVRAEPLARSGAQARANGGWLAGVPGHAAV